MAPLGRAGITSALVALRGAALDGYVPAAAALSAVISRELGFSGYEEFLFSVGTPEELVSAAHVPSLVRLYALGFIPGAVLAYHEAISVGPENELLESAYRGLRLCVRRNSPFQDEALRALLLHLAAADASSERGSFLRLYSNVVRSIVYQARVVPGRNMNTRFEVGRELLLSERGISALTFATFHEFGHFLDFAGGARAGTATRVGSEEDLHAIDELAPQLMEIAEQLVGTPLRPGDGRRRSLPSGVFVLCTMERISETSRWFIHVSFSVSGNPVELVDAAGCTLRFLCALGIRPEEAAAAHSTSGIFHVGFFTAPTDADAAPVADWSADAAVEWLESLRAAGRLAQHEREIPELLLGESMPIRLYAQSMQSVRDARFCHLVNSEALGGAEPHILHAFALHLANAETDPATRDGVLASGPLGAAVRSADPVTLRHVLAASANVPAENPPTYAQLASLGSSCALLRQSTGIGFVGATAAGIEDVVRQLVNAGFSVDEELDDLGSTLLIEAAARSPRWLDLLLGLGADPARADARGQTPLISAGQSGHRDAVAKLLAAGADPDGQDNDRRSALMYALEYMWPEVTELLLRGGADPDLTTNDGTAAMHYAVTIPIESIRKQIVALLAEAGAALDEEMDNGMTPMALAAAKKLDDTVAQLRALGATA